MDKLREYVSHFFVSVLFLHKSLEYMYTVAPSFVNSSLVYIFDPLNFDALSLSPLLLRKWQDLLLVPCTVKLRPL